MKRKLFIFNFVYLIVSCSCLIVYGQNKTNTDLLTIELVTVDGGSFQMGADDGTPVEKPIHTVNISSFSIAKYEVTQAQWLAVMGNNTSFHATCSKCPVENITLNDIQDYIDRLNKLTSMHYRLPTEAEWEFAATGGNMSKHYRYSGSDVCDSVGWTRLNSKDTTHPIGTKKPNELGIYDMSGNVQEWTKDWYDGEYYKNSPEDDPRGPVNGKAYVVRGGSCLLNAFFCRITSRSGSFPDIANRDLGFRLAMDK